MQRQKLLGSVWWCVVISFSENVHQGHTSMLNIDCIHFVGIGGVGMGGIAEVLLNLGYKVSGSDLGKNAMTKRLAELGATIYHGHNAKCIKDADVVVVSSAVANDNVEIVAARELRLPVVQRAEMLAELMRFRFGIAIAGTHGKTTTTSLVASVMESGGLDPTFVIGGRLNSAGCNAHLGESRYLVAEADESDASFLYLNPMIAVITNIDSDHMETYQSDFNQLKKAFVEFLHHLPFYGLAVMCIDDPVVEELIPTIARRVMTYGFSEQADIRAVGYQQQGLVSRFGVHCGQSGEQAQITLNLPGKHNVQNALAAIAIARELKISFEKIEQAFLQFAGIGRRMQVYGDFPTKAGKVTLIDDYGHHPREVSVTLEALRQAWPDKRLVMIYQPHRYTRTRDLFDEFSKVLSSVDVLLMLDVYSAGEEPIVGADSQSLCRTIRQHGRVDPIYVGQSTELAMALENVLQADDVLLTQGAGNVGAIASQLAESELNFAQCQFNDPR